MKRYCSSEVVDSSHKYFSARECIFRARSSQRCRVLRQWPSVGGAFLTATAGARALLCIDEVQY